MNIILKCGEAPQKEFSKEGRGQVISLVETCHRRGNLFSKVRVLAAHNLIKSQGQLAYLHFSNQIHHISS